MLWPLCGGCDKRQIDFRLVERREFHLGFLGCFAQALKRHRIFTQVDAVGLLEFVGNIFHEPLIEVVAAEMRVAIRRLHFKHTITEFKNRDIERSATEIEHGDLRVFSFFVKAVSQCGCGRLIDNAAHVQAGNFARLFRCLALRIIEICGHRNHGIRYLLAEIIFSSLFHFLKNHRRDFRRRVDTVINLDARRIVFARDNFVRNEFHFFVHFVHETSHEPLDRVHGILGIRDCLAFCRLSNQTLSIFCKADDGRRCPHSFSIRNYHRIISFHYRNDGIGGTKVDSNDFACHLRLLCSIVRLIYKISVNITAIGMPREFC